MVKMWIDEGLIGSICRHCANWVFYDWYLCEFAPDGKSMNNALDLPILKCENFKNEGSADK